jgi:hypothetical protein
VISSDGLLVVLGLSEGYATQKRMTGANEGFLEDRCTQANVVGEKLQRACGLNIWFEWDPTKACSTGDAGSFIVRRVVRAVWQKKPKAEWVRVAKVRGGSGGVGACKKACIGRAGKSGYGTDMRDGDREGW